MPCAIAQAFGLNDTSRPYIKLAAGTYLAGISITGKQLIVHGTGAMVTATSGVPAFTILDGSNVRLIGLSTINTSPNNSRMGIECRTNSSGPTPIVALEDVTVESTSDASILTQPCNLTVSRSRLIAHSTIPNVFATPDSTVLIDRSIVDGGNGVIAEGGTTSVRITNSVIRNMTGDNGAFLGSAVFAPAPGSLTVSFSTIIGSRVICGSGTPRCAASGASGAGSCVDNSIIFNAGGPADTVQGSACRANNSIVFPQSTTINGINNQLGVSPQLRSASTGDYHLLQASSAIDQADPAATNAIDFDGVLRPQGAGRDIGAFEYKP